LLPTVSTTDIGTPLTQESKTKFLNNRKQKGLTAVPSALNQLRQMAYEGLLPTPTTHDSKHSTTKSPSWERRIEQKHLAETVLNPYIQETGGKPSQLNPQFVMEMMGFPTDWTELPFLNGDKNQLKQGGMQ
jgi:hypothetical protein